MPSIPLPNFICIHLPCSSLLYSGSPPPFPKSTLSFYPPRHILHISTPISSFNKLLSLLVFCGQGCITLSRSTMVASLCWEEHYRTHSLFERDVRNKHRIKTEVGIKLCNKTEVRTTWLLHILSLLLKVLLQAVEGTEQFWGVHSTTSLPPWVVTHPTVAQCNVALLWSSSCHKCASSGGQPYNSFLVYCGFGPCLWLVMMEGGPGNQGYCKLPCWEQTHICTAN